MLERWSITFCTSSGGVIAVQGYESLGNIGIEALTGFLSAFLNVRIVAPVVAGIALAATIGAGTTAQLGAMRVAEEIDAIESMAVHSVSYLVSTRLIAGEFDPSPRRGSARVARAGVTGCQKLWYSTPIKLQCSVGKTLISWGSHSDGCVSGLRVHRIGI